MLREAGDIEALLALLSPGEREKLVDKVKLPSAKILIKSTHLVLKWGGELTHVGRVQSIAVGQELFKHPDLRRASYYSEHESRVLGTADLVLRSMLRVTSLPRGLLNVFAEDSSNDKDAKTQLNPVIPSSLLDKMHLIYQSITHPRAINQCESSITKCRESKAQVLDRWRGLCERVRISDLYDALKYDLVHHRPWLQELLDSQTFWTELYEEVRGLYAGQIGPFELGGQPGAMSRSILSPKILPLIMNGLREDRALMVFTKEAQMQSVMHLVTGGYRNCGWSEMDYASVIRIEVVGGEGARTIVNLWRSRGALMIDEGHEICEGDVARLEKESLIESLTLEELVQRLQ